MSDRPTATESNVQRCAAFQIATDVKMVGDIKAALDAFLTYRQSYDRSQMTYLAGILINKLSLLLAPHLCDIGILAHHESLSDEEYDKLMEDIRLAQEGLDNLEGEDTDEDE